jgi:hypothetical protein
MEILAALKDTPLPTILVIGGLIFLFLGIATIKKPIVINVQPPSNRKISIILGSVLVCLGLGLLFLPTPGNVSEIPTATPIVSLNPIASSTPSLLPPTLTPLPTNTITPTATATPIPGDFEISDEGWGNYPANEIVHPGENVKIYCDNSLPINHTGNCSLEYQPLNIVDGNAYVARVANPDDVKSKISIWVYVPSSELCSGNKCSTARVIVWDSNYKSYEGDPVTLNQIGNWVEITLDLSGTNYPQPYQVIGVHFYLSTQYEGTLYIDSVSTTKP